MPTIGNKYFALALVVSLAAAPISAFAASSVGGNDAAANGGAGTSAAGVGGASTGAGNETNGGNAGAMTGAGSTSGMTSGQPAIKKSGAAGCEPTGGAMTSSANCGSKAPGG